MTAMLGKLLLTTAVVLAAIHGSNAQACFNPRTPTQYSYNWNIAELTGDIFEFRVKAQHDVFVALSSQNQVVPNMYEFNIGGWDNTQSVIRRSPLGPNLVEVPTPGIVSPSYYATFWIRWSADGTIAVGRGGALQPFMQWQDPDPLPVHYVGYSTGWGSDGEWMFCGVCVIPSTEDTGDQDQYNWEFSQLSGNFIEFEVKAHNDATVALSSKNLNLVDMYEITIGGWDNTQSVIRRSPQGPIRTAVQTPGIVSPSKYATFWIRWSADGTIAVGRGGALQPFMYWTDPDPLPINYVGYKTGWGSTGQWIFCPVYAADIVLTLDESSSIPRTQFALARDFMLDFIACEAFEGQDIRVGVILYNCVPRTYFDLGKYTFNSRRMRGAIDYMMHEGGESRTGVAIRYMRATSDFRDGVPGAAVIFTDGETSDDSAYEAGVARAAGINLYAVGVGFQAFVDQAALETITDDSDRVFDTTQACVAAQKIMDDLIG